MKRGSKKKGAEAALAEDSVRLEGDLTIYTAAQLKEQVLAELTTRERLTLDLSAVSEIDTAGLQVLLLAGREALAAGKNFSIAQASGCVTEALQLANAPISISTHTQS